MGLSPELQALDAHLRERNIRRAPVDTSVSMPSVGQIGGFALAATYLSHDPEGAWCVRYRYAADRMTYTHRSTDPRELVQFMRDTFKGSSHLIIVKVWADPCDICGRKADPESPDNLCRRCRVEQAEGSGESRTFDDALGANGDAQEQAREAFELKHS